MRCWLGGCEVACVAQATHKQCKVCCSIRPAGLTIIVHADLLPGCCSAGQRHSLSVAAAAWWPKLALAGGLMHCLR